MAEEKAKLEKALCTKQLVPDNGFSLGQKLHNRNFCYRTFGRNLLILDFMALHSTTWSFRKQFSLQLLKILEAYDLKTVTHYYWKMCNDNWNLNLSKLRLYIIFVYMGYFFQNPLEYFWSLATTGSVPLRTNFSEFFQIFKMIIARLDFFFKFTYIFSWGWVGEKIKKQ